jgi:hypothetical protein
LDAEQASPDGFVIRRDRPAFARRHRDDEELREQDAQDPLGPDKRFGITPSSSIFRA